MMEPVLGPMKKGTPVVEMKHIIGLPDLKKYFHFLQGSSKTPGPAEGIQIFVGRVFQTIFCGIQHRAVHPEQMLSS